MHTAHEATAPQVSRRLIIALLVIAALAPFAQTLGYGYVMDDTTVIRSNPDIDGWRSLIEVWRQPYGGLRSQGSGLYRPLTMTLFAFVWNAGGHWPLWFHVLVVGMHAAAVVMVWRLLSPSLALWPSMLAALWFAVHPVHVEAVANIAFSSEILVALWTCALALYLARAQRQSGPVPWSRAATCGALYLAAFLSKESGAVAPLLAALWLWGWVREAREPSDASTDRQISSVAARWWRVAVAWIVAALIVFTLRALVLAAPLPGSAMVAPGLDEFSGPRRIWAMLSLAPTVLGLLVWPGSTNPHYGPSAFPQTNVGLWVAVGLIAIFVATLAALALARRGDRRMLAALGWTAVAFLPASNILVGTGQILAERTLYVPSIGVAMLFGLLLDALWSRWTTLRSTARRAAKAAAIAAAGCIIAVFAVRASRSAGVWRNHTTLFSQMIAADSAGYRGYWLSGMDARYRGDSAKGLSLLATAYALYPRDRALLVEYSGALSHAGEHVRAASIASELMNWPQSRKDPGAVAFYLAAVSRAYGPDSAMAAMRRLTSGTNAPLRQGTP